MEKLKGEVSVLFVVVNWINMLGIVEDILVKGYVDMVLMVCLFLVDVDLVKKMMEGWVDEINICIGCNQVCLDYIFEMKICFCLVNF